MPDVVPVAPLRLAITAWVPAVLIPQDEGCVHRRRDRAGRAPVVEDRRLTIGDDPMVVRVASQSVQLRGGDSGNVEQSPRLDLTEDGRSEGTWHVMEGAVPRTVIC